MPNANPGLPSAQDDESDMHARGLRSLADIMLDPLQRNPRGGVSSSEGAGGGSSGGSRERSAWTLLACYSDDKDTVAKACEGALSKGLALDDLAAHAVSCDAWMALGWCLEAGMTPASSIRFYGGAHELANVAIESEAPACVGLLERRAGPLSLLESHQSGGSALADEAASPRQDALAYCARRFKLGSLRAILDERSALGRLAPSQVDEALSVVVGRLSTHWSSGQSNPALLIKELMARGALLGGEPDAEAERKLPAHGHAISRLRFVPRLRGAAHGSEGSHETRRGVSDAWEAVLSQPGWTRWTNGSETLGAHCLGLAGLGGEGLGEVVHDHPALLAQPEAWEALARAAVEKAKLGMPSPTALIALAPGPWRDLSFAPCARVEKMVEILSKAWPGEPKQVLRGLSVGMAEVCEAFEGLCSDPQFARAAGEAKDLFKEASKDGFAMDDAIWARWEAVGIRIAIAGMRSDARPAAPRL